MKKDKILFIMPLPPPVHGVSKISQVILSSQRLNEEFDIEVINSSTSRSLSEINNKFQFFKLFRSGQLFFALFKKLICNRYDACCIAMTVTGMGFLKDFPLVLLCKLFFQKVVIYQHNRGADKYSGRMFYDCLFRIAYHRSKVILLSWRLYFEIEKYVKKIDIYICPNGIPTELPTAETGNDETAKESAPPFRLLYLSHMQKAKGCFVLLEALNKLNADNYNFHCDFIGAASADFAITDFLSQIESYHLTEKVTWHGEQYGESKDAFYRQSDLLVFPTLRECFPLVILEAMQHSLPVLASDEGGIADIIVERETGFMVNSGDPNALYIKLCQIINMTAPERQQMRDCARNRFLQNFTVAQYEKRLSEILHACTGKTTLHEV